MAVNIINSVYQLFNHDINTFLLLAAINSSGATVYLILHKIKKVKIEISITITVFILLLMKLIMFKVDVLEYSVLFSYGIMLIIKEVKSKLLPIIILVLTVFILGTISMMINEGNIARMSNNILLITIMCITHYLIYYDSYKETPDIKKLYNLTKLDMIILDSLFLPDPCLKTMQNYVLKKDIHCSKTYVKDRLQQFYDIFDIKSGGSRKTELVVRLVRLGYTP